MERLTVSRDYSHIKIGDGRMFLTLIDTFMGDYSFGNIKYESIQMGKFLCKCGTYASFPMEMIFGNIKSYYRKSCGGASCVSALVRRTPKNSKDKAPSLPKKPLLPKKPVSVLALADKSEQGPTLQAVIVSILGYDIECISGDRVEVKFSDNKVTILVNGEFDCMFRSR